MSAAEFMCPRRTETPAAAAVHEAFPGPDHYEPSHGLVSQPLGCTWCGSMPPDDFMAAISDGAQISPTDKNYKAYVQLAGGEAKFYFQHLDEAQRDEFIRLLNAKTLNIGYPGRFYQLPYFVTVAPRSTS